MSSASDFPKGMQRPWTPADIARLIQEKMPEISERMVHEMLRDSEAPPVPYFGKVGNARLFDESLVRSKLPAMLRWFETANQRMQERRAATMRADAERARAALEEQPTAWPDMHADARRARRAPPGFIAADEPRKREKTGRIGKPAGGFQ